MACRVPMDRIARRLECGRPVNSSKTMNTNISNIVNRKSARWLVLVLVALMAVSSLAGLAAAQLDGTETVYHNETVPITNDTTDLNVTIGESGATDVFVNFYRIADDSESTETLESEDVNLNSRTNASSPVETNNTAAYRVVVHDKGDEYSPMASTVDNITVTQFPLGSGVVDSGNDSLDGGAVDSGNDSLVGGPVGFGGDSGNGTIIGIIAVVALALVVRMKA